MVKSLNPPAGKDLEIEKPILGRHLPTLDFNGTFAPIYRPALVRNQIRQNCKPIEKDPLASLFVMEPFHHEQLSVYRIVELIY